MLKGFEGRLEWLPVYSHLQYMNNAVDEKIIESFYRNQLNFLT